MCTLRNAPTGNHWKTTDQNDAKKSKSSAKRFRTLHTFRFRSYRTVSHSLVLILSDLLRINTKSFSHSIPSQTVYIYRAALEITYTNEAQRRVLPYQDRKINKNFENTHHSPELGSNQKLYSTQTPCSSINIPN